VGICKAFQPAYAFESYIIVEKSVLPNCDCTPGKYIRDYMCYPCPAGTTSGGIVFEDDIESFSACSTCPTGYSIPTVYRGYPANNRVQLGIPVTDENDCANKCVNTHYQSEFFYTYEDTRGQDNFCYCIRPVQNIVLAGVAASEVTTMTEACAIVGGTPITSAEECEQAVPFAVGLRKARCDADEQYYCDNPSVTFNPSATTAYNALGCKYTGNVLMWATSIWHDQYTEFCTDGYACVCKIDPPPKATDHVLGPVDFNKYVTYRIDRSLIVYDGIDGGFSIQSTGSYNLPKHKTRELACQSLGGIPVTSEHKCRQVFEQFNGLLSPDGSADTISNYKSSYNGFSLGCGVSGSTVFWSITEDDTYTNRCIGNYQCICFVPNPGSKVTASTVNFCV